MKGISLKAALGAIALVVCAWSVPSNATVLETDLLHNGYTFPLDGPLNISETEEVNVGLADLYGTPVGELCYAVGADLCLGKVWLPGSALETHQMLIDTDYSELAILEFVVNGTGLDWTDYQVYIEGGYIADGFALILDIIDGSLADISGIGSAMVDASSAWLFFDQPFGTFDKSTFTGQILVMGGLITGIDGGIFVAQAPSIPEPGTISLLAFGFVGLGAMQRRRREAA